MDYWMGLVKGINEILWENVLIYLLIGTGLYFTIRLRGIQMRRMGMAFKNTFGGLFKKKEKADEDGMSSFQALATAVAAQVGTGNLAGVATAIISGGPGAVFWMWLSGLFGMGTIFAEAVLAQVFKRKDDGGEVTGGPAYYIRYGLNKPVLAGVFSVTIILALGFMGNMVQSNSIAQTFTAAFNVQRWVIGLVLAIVVFLIISGGISRIASFTELLVPFMAAFYLLGGLVILIMNASMVGPAFRMIFEGAFTPQAVVGGAVGTAIKNAMRYGIARGLFSNEAGMGSTPHAHAVAKVKHPGDQGLVAMLGVVIDTLLVCTMTALIILTTGAHTHGLKAAEVTQSAFGVAWGSFGTIFIAVCLLFFALSTIIGWSFFGEANVRFLFPPGAVKIYRILVPLFVFLGTTMDADIVWEMADMFNGFMVLPNLVGLILLSGLVVKVCQDYEDNYLAGRPYEYKGDIVNFERKR